MAPDNTTPPAAESTPPQQWRSVEEYLDSAAFAEAMQDEFPDQASEWTDPVTRRRFLTIMGASLALAGAAGCSVRPAPRRQITPYSRQPEEMTPGVPLFFASSYTLSGVSTGVIVRSHEGRPVKVEGNPDHTGCANPADPTRHAGTDVFAQASLLDLYDPDRSKQVTHLGQPGVYGEALHAVRAQLDAQRGAKAGAGVRLLTGAVAAGTALADQIQSLLTEFPGARWCQFEPIGRENVREGTRRAFGRPLNVIYDFTAADVVVSLDADFLTAMPGHIRYCNDFASRRRVRSDINLLEQEEHLYVAATEEVVKHKYEGNEKVKVLNRVYAVECMPGTAGSVADHRLPLKSSEVEAFARALAQALGVPGVTGAKAPTDQAQKWATVIAKDLTTKDGKPREKGTTVVVPGDHQPPAVHALAHAINSHLGNHGHTVVLTESIESLPRDAKDQQHIDLPTLTAQMTAGQVETLLLFGAPNPVYTAPADLDFAGALAKVPFKLHLGSHQDETAVLCEWHVNEAHYLECWGDGRGYDGSATLQQPLIAPLYSGKSVLEFLTVARVSPVLGNPTTPPPASGGREIVRAFWHKWFAEHGNDGRGFFGREAASMVNQVAAGHDGFEPFWQEAVRSGVIPNSAAPKVSVPLGKWSEGPPTPPLTSGDLEVNFRGDPTLYDGRFANNGWMQELPKPVTKLTWDNAAFVSPKTAREKGISEKDFRWTAGEHGRAEVAVVELEYQGRKVQAPVWVLPGHADNAITIHLGHGRERAGQVGYSEAEPNAAGKMARGFNAYTLRTQGHLWTDGGLKLTKTSKTYFLACTQGSGAMSGTNDPITGKPINRRPARRLDTKEYDQDPFAARLPPTAAGETELINRNVPGPAGEYNPESGTQGRNGLAPPHEHKKGEEHEHKHEDARLIPLTMYHPNDNLAPGQRPDQARRWAMAIDLGACTGCNACVVACQAENNIPVVGKREVTRGHEMYWIRVDRYYEGNPDDAAHLQTHFQPVPCQQCEKAPCEVVCPVGATVHSTDGLNDMVFNRCVGTRYCSNNCPYKVRRFNFLTFQDWATETFKLGRNPDVTVRSRGVMEKCTYCVQRIRYGEIVAEREGRPIRDGEVRTACQTACPSGAILFGDLNDATSRVGKWKGEPTNYGLMAELNTMPRTTYLAGVRNPNPALKQ